MLSEQLSLLDPPRFWSKVDSSGGQHVCWPWLGSITLSNGYGQHPGVSPLTGRPTMRAAHRCALEIATRSVLPPAVRVLHAKGCSKLCCNPKHLRPGTAAENTADARRDGALRGKRLDADRVRKLLGLHQAGVTRESLADRFGVSLVTVHSILTGRTWSNISGIEFAGPRKGGRPRKPKVAKPTMEQRRQRVQEALS
ncbi:MAG: hypothetical protein EKK41_21200 [Hyphomicrobiales bacterium]|nr:MAG: hypothetical protein EKK41_21200 [Hyphomicrobiales bacterium]